MDKIIFTEGFGDTRYKMVWLHSPNPDDACELAVLANQAAMLDKKLPLREVKPMPVSMNKNHLMSALLMQAQGGRFFPSDGNEISRDFG